MAARFCHACMAPLDAPALWGPSAHYCRNCTDASGALHPRENIRKDIAQWLRSWQPGLDDKEAQRRADLFMRALPAWAVEEPSEPAPPKAPKPKPAGKTARAKPKPAAARRSTKPS